METTKRMNQINELIKCIGENDKHRRTPIFHSKDNNEQISQGIFILGEDNLLYYIDPYTKEHIRPINNEKEEYNFSGGGTTWEILLDFGRFILNGEPGSLRDYKETWGFEYAETMNVRKKAKEIGYISDINYALSLYSR